MFYEVKTFKVGRENHFNSYLFDVYSSAMEFIHSFQQTHGNTWVIEFIEEE